jgi:hypothetical protein
MSKTRTPVGTVGEIWRYPVKSLGGERLEAAAIDEHGVEGDRIWALRDEKTGAITTARKIPALLWLAARLVPGSERDVVITLPDGAEVRSDDPDVHARISAAVGRSVTLHPLRPASDRKHFRAQKLTTEAMREDFAIAPGEPLPDFSSMPMAKLLELQKYATPPGTYFDAYTLHVVTTSSLAYLRARAPGSDFDARRFRANLVIDSGGDGGLVEAAWPGGALHAGELAAAIVCTTVRCSIPTRVQAGLGADPAILKTILTEAERCLGVYATPTRAGRVRVGESVEVDRTAPSALRRWFDTSRTRLKRLVLRATAATLPRR